MHRRGWPAFQDPPLISRSLELPGLSLLALSSVYTVGKGVTFPDGTCTQLAKPGSCYLDAAGSAWPSLQLKAAVSLQWRHTLVCDYCCLYRLLHVS